MPDSSSDVIKWILGCVTAIIGLANTVILTLGMYILRSISKKGEENGADIRRAHQRIDEIEGKRQIAWIDKEKECGQEKADRYKLEERINHMERK